MKEAGRTWGPIEEPEDVVLVRDRDGDLWQRCRDEGWECVHEYRHAGMPRVGGDSWQAVLAYAPLVEIEPPSLPWE